MSDYPYGYCGMPCALCSRHRTEGTSKCPGCSHDGYYTDPCKVHHCCTEKQLRHCGLCQDFPCKRLGKMSDFSDLHTNHVKDKTCTSIAEDGFSKWYEEYEIKAELLTQALTLYNNGRMKRFLCELFIQQDLATLQQIMEEAKKLRGTPKEIGKDFQIIVQEILAKNREDV